VFRRTVRGTRAGDVRARSLATGETAIPFSLRVPPDHVYNPFGLPTPLEPKRR